jgi:hypothetical protein
MFPLSDFGAEKSSDPNEQQKFGQICDNKTFFFLSFNSGQTLSTIDTYFQALFTSYFSFGLNVCAHWHDRTSLSRRLLTRVVAASLGMERLTLGSNHMLYNFHRCY